MTGSERPDGPDGDAPADPAEARLLELMAPLRAERPSGDPGMALAVVSRARWQTQLRGALRLAGQLVASVADAASLLLGRGRRRES